MMNVNTVGSRHALWAPLSMSVLISACGTFGPQDGPPTRTISAADIRDAVPKYEPLSKQGNPDSYIVDGKTYYVMDNATGYVQRGKASWYGKKFHGRRTANGEIYDMFAMSAAHKSLPLPTYVQVTNLDNHKRTIVRVNDRGPFHADRLIDLSYAAAVKLGITENGTAPVEVKALARISHQQSTAVLSTPAPAPAPAKAFTNGRFVQVGAFADQGNAQRLQERLSLHISYPVTISNSDSNVNNSYYRVRIGPFHDRQAIQDVQSRLWGLGIKETLILEN